MKLMTILGTRPEIIRLSLIIEKLDEYAQQHVLLHTGQNHDKALYDIFFEQMRIRQPDYAIASTAHSIGRQLGVMFSKAEEIIEAEQPDKVLVLGDTNSALCSMVAARMNIPVYHMEAGNRCFDRSVPEETNRRMIDAIADFNLPYTRTSRENLLREGIPSSRIWVSGNPIYEVLQHYAADISKSSILKDLNLRSGEYLLATVHRAENVDDEERLRDIFAGIEQASNQIQMPVICSVHPRTKARLQQFHLLEHSPLLRLCNPFGFFDFIKLEQHARCVVTDSGTVQEESCLFRIPTVTVRRSTERPETVECGSNILAGVNGAHIADCVQLALRQPRQWTVPDGYEVPDVSRKVANFILGGLSYV